MAAKNRLSAFTSKKRLPDRADNRSASRLRRARAMMVFQHRHNGRGSLHEHYNHWRGFGEVCVSVCTINATGRVQSRQELKREAFGLWLAQVPAGTVVAMETCGGAHQWARRCMAYGLQPRILAEEFPLSPAITDWKVDACREPGVCSQAKEAKWRPRLRMRVGMNGHAGSGCQRTPRSVSARELPKLSLSTTMECRSVRRRGSPREVPRMHLCVLFRVTRQQSRRERASRRDDPWGTCCTIRR